MKKLIYLFLTILIQGSYLFAQEDVMIIDRPYIGDDNPGLCGSWLSTHGNADLGFYSADFFTLEEETALGTFTFFGGADDLSAELLGGDLYIYEDAGGIPSSNPSNPDGLLRLVDVSGACCFDMICNGEESTINQCNYRTIFEVYVANSNGGIPVILPAGSYWLVFAPYVTGNSLGEAGQDPGKWYWSRSGITSANEPVFIDPSDRLGVLGEPSATEWTNVTDYILGIIPGGSCTEANFAFTSFTWTLTGHTPIVPDNDICENSTQLVCGSEFLGNTIYATNTGAPTEGQVCDIGFDTAPGVWHKLTIPIDGDYDVVVDTFGSGFDTLLGVFSGDCDELVCVAENDDSGGLYWSEVQFTGVADRDYYIYVTGSTNLDFGDYELNNSCELILDIKENALVDISISPNPARSIFTLDATQEVLMIDIMNLLGERVSSIEVSNTTTNINISQYKTGVYLAKIIFSNGNIQTIKFIKE